MRPLSLLALVLGLASLVALGYSVSDLAGGIREVPRHWWSVMPIVGLGGAFVLVAWDRRGGSGRRPGT